jgi:uncharacterized protein
MQSKQTKTFQVQAPIKKVWLFLSDPRKVAPCLPGAQITEAIDDRTFKGTITVKIGPVSMQFNGQMKVERLDPQNYEMELSGTGQDPRGGGGASMKMSGKLRALSANETEVTGTIESTITGRLAQFGARMMDDVSNHLFNQFTKAFQAKLAEEPNENPPAANPSSPAPEPEPLRVIPLLFAVLKNFFARLFRRL